MNPGAFVKYCALLTVVPAFSVLCGCGLFESPSSEQVPTVDHAEFYFSFGGDSATGEIELLVETTELYRCAMVHLDARMNRSRNTIRVDIDSIGVRLVGCLPECPSYSAWYKATVGLPEDAYVVLFTCGGKTDVYRVTIDGKTARPHTVEDAPPTFVLPKYQEFDVRKPAEATFVPWV